MAADKDVVELANSFYKELKKSPNGDSLSTLYPPGWVFLNFSTVDRKFMDRTGYDSKLISEAFSQVLNKGTMTYGKLRAFGRYLSEIPKFSELSMDLTLVSMFYYMGFNEESRHPIYSKLEGKGLAQPVDVAWTFEVFIEENRPEGLTKVCYANMISLMSEPQKMKEISTAYISLLRECTKNLPSRPK